MKKINKFILALLFVFSVVQLHSNTIECPILALANDISTSGTEFKALIKNPEIFKAWNLLNKETPALRTNIEELKLVSKNLDEISKVGGYIKWKDLNTVQRHPNWVQIIDITNKVENLTPHVLTVETNLDGTFIPKSKTINTTTFNMEGFKGCHTENALKDYIETFGGTYVVKNKSVGIGGVYDGQPVIYLNNKEYVKINGIFVEYQPGKLGGTSSFFPESWSNIKIKEEVEFAIANNHGIVPGKTTELFGFSRDGTVEIRFYYNADGTIGSYFPKKN